MNKLHYFNPENDLALAAGIANYTAPEAAMKLHRAGAALPLWYAEEGDSVLCYGVNADWIERAQRDFGISPMPYNHSDTLEPDPWGWSLAAKRDFLKEGLPEDMLPADDKIGKLRKLSHRATGAFAARKAMEMCPRIQFACLPAIEVADIADVEQSIGGNTKLVLKSPWSCSGRGVAIVSEVGPDRALRFAADSIRRQGSVMVEELVDKALDFAKLYECRGGKCVEIGTSVFSTDSRGAYNGNLLIPERERLARVGAYCDLGELAFVAEALRQAIEDIYAPYYNGIVGVDMLTDKQGRLDPVVEINMRKTMGYVANTFADRYLAAGAIGVFRVLPARNKPIADYYEAEGGKLASGTLSLIPPSPFFQITASVDQA